MSDNATTITNINPKSCIYGCGLQIYWNTSTNEYWGVFTQKKHICPNRSSSQSKPTSTNTAIATATKPTYYNKKPWNSQQLIDFLICYKNRIS